MSNKKTYIRLVEDAMRYRKGLGPAHINFIKALRELIDRCPDVTNEELKDLLEKAEREFCK